MRINIFFIFIVFNYFHNEYTMLLRDFLERHDIEVKESDCLINYIYKTLMDFQYK